MSTPFSPCQFCGYTDEVLDLQFMGDNDSHLVMATNSEHLKVFDIDTWDCQILYGHTDIVLSVCVHHRKHLIASSSKVGILLQSSKLYVLAVTCLGTYVLLPLSKTKSYQWSTSMAFFSEKIFSHFEQT